MAHAITIYDTTLRDGTQGEGVQVAVADKLRLARVFDDVGFHFIEAGWPGSNPRDAEFFQLAKREQFATSKLVAFGATHRPGLTCEDDMSVQALIRSEVPAVAIFGKASSFQVEKILNVRLEENLSMVYDTVRYLKRYFDTVVFDAEHFFDGYWQDPDYALSVLSVATDAGASWVTLCDTNGGSLPTDVRRATAAASMVVSAPLGIHAHNDTGMAVANSLSAIRAGATMLQGTVNGHGERCGNADLITSIANLELKMGFECLGAEGLAGLKALSKTVDRYAHCRPNPAQPYVGERAFAHKGGVHVHAVMKESRAYEHVSPERIGNSRRILVSDLAGRSALAEKAREFGIQADAKSSWIGRALERVKELENQGYRFEDSDASLELLLLSEGTDAREAIQFQGARILAEVGDYADEGDSERSEAQIKLCLHGATVEASASGRGPVHALALAFQKACGDVFPLVAQVKLEEYRVDVLDEQEGFGARVRVCIRATDGQQSWDVQGVSHNIIEASSQAIADAYEYAMVVISRLGRCNENGRSEPGLVQVK